MLWAVVGWSWVRRGLRWIVFVAQSRRLGGLGSNLPAAVVMVVVVEGLLGEWKKKYWGLCQQRDL